MIIAAFAVLLVAAIPMFYPFEFLPESLRAAAAAAVVISALTLFLLRGLILERILSKRMFRRADGKAAQFKDFDTPNVEHVICSTEMASGRPVYFSTCSSGRVVIRLAEDEYTPTYGFRHAVRTCAK